MSYKKEEEEKEDGELTGDMNEDKDFGGDLTDDFDPMLDDDLDMGDDDDDKPYGGFGDENEDLGY